MPAQWPKLADELSQAANGDGSDLAIAFRDGRDALQAALVPATALQCADPPGLALRG